MRIPDMAKRDQTTGEEIANTVTHVIGSHLGAAMLALLVWKGATSGVDVAWKTTSGAIFGFSMISTSFETAALPISAVFWT